MTTMMMMEFKIWKEIFHSKQFRHFVFFFSLSQESSSESQQIKNRKKITNGGCPNQLHTIIIDDKNIKNQCFIRMAGRGITKNHIHKNLHLKILFTDHYTNVVFDLMKMRGTKENWKFQNQKKFHHQNNTQLTNRKKIIGFQTKLNKNKQPNQNNQERERGKIVIRCCCSRPLLLLLLFGSGVYFFFFVFVFIFLVVFISRLSKLLLLLYSTTTINACFFFFITRHETNNKKKTLSSFINNNIFWGEDRGIQEGKKKTPP